MGSISVSIFQKNEVFVFKFIKTNSLRSEASRQNSVDDRNERHAIFQILVPTPFLFSSSRELVPQSHTYIDGRRSLWGFIHMLPSGHGCPVLSLLLHFNLRRPFLEQRHCFEKWLVWHNSLRRHTKHGTRGATKTIRYPWNNGRVDSLTVLPWHLRAMAMMAMQECLLVLRPRSKPSRAPTTNPQTPWNSNSVSPHMIWL